MTRKDLKNYLDNQKWLEEQLENYEAKKEKVIKITQTLNGMPKASGKPNYELEELMDEYNKILVLIKKDQEKQNKILEQLNCLEPLYKRILTKRYIEGKKLEEIAVEINYNYYTTCRYNGYALNEFDKLDKNNIDKKDSKKSQDIAK